MKIRALKNWGKVRYCFKKGINGKPLCFKKKELKFYDIHIPNEKREYDFWIDRLFPKISDATEGEYIKLYVEKEIERRNGTNN